MRPHKEIKLPSLSWFCQRILLHTAAENMTSRCVSQIWLLWKTIPESQYSAILGTWIQHYSRFQEKWGKDMEAVKRTKWFIQSKDSLKLKPSWHLQDGHRCRHEILGNSLNLSNHHFYPNNTILRYCSLISHWVPWHPSTGVYLIFHNKIYHCGA